MKKKITKTVILKEEYELSTEISYVRIITNNKITSNTLVYKGKKVNEYGLSPMYQMDLSILKIWNPFWGENKQLKLNKDYSWLKEKPLPEPEEINLNEIIFSQSSNHRFYDINKEPIPVVIQGDYIGANLDNRYYNLEKLKKHFDNHKNIISCSEILDIPYYNRDENRTKYLHVMVYPEKKWLLELDKNKINLRDIFTSTYDKTHPDFLKIRKFQKQIDYLTE